MDVELEEVEELVGYEVDGAIDFLFDSEEEFERPAGFVAAWEGDVLELPRGVGYVFASFAGGRLVLQLGCQTCRPYIVRFRQLTGIGSPGL